MEIHPLMLIFALVLNLLPQLAFAAIENYYCGDHNCYDLLEVTRDVSKADIKRAFRAVASKTHPDKFLDPEEKLAAEERFRLLSTAYDILRDDEARSDYDYMLDNPDQFYMNYYRAWRRRVAPKVDVRIVIAVTVSLISLVQYYNGWTKYEEAIKHFSSVPKYRMHAIDLAKKQGLLETDKKKLRGKSKEELKQYEEKIIRQVIESKMDIRGVYAKPTYKDLLWVQMILLPLWAWQYCYWWCRWVWKFWICKEDYGIEEKYYLIRRNLGMSHGQFESLDEPQKEDYLALGLWVKENFHMWKDEREEELRVKMAQSGRYKSYRRYMKAHGPGRMYFDDS